MTTVPGVSNNELVRTTWGQRVADELNLRTLKVTGTTESGAVMTGSLIIKNDAAAAIRLRRAAESPFLQFENSTGVTVFATIQGTLATVIHNIVSATGAHSFRVNNAMSATIDAGGILLPSGKTVDAPSGRFGNTGTTPQLLVIDTNGGGAAAHANVSFYPAGTALDAPGTRGGYVGYDAAGFQLQATPELIVASTTADVKLDGQTDIRFVTVDVERMRLVGPAMLFGKTVDDLTTAGASIYCAGSAAEGSIHSVTGVTTAVANLFTKHVGGADADGQPFFLAQRGDGTSVGSIAQHTGNNTIFNAGAGGQHTTTSDYRLKDDLGPIVDPVGRVMALAPKHLRWKPEAGTEGEFDNFLAHEVQAVVPDAVSGDKDATWPQDAPVNPGGIRAQGLDTSKLVPLLTAALQEALTTISDLTDRVAALEAV